MPTAPTQRRVVTGFDRYVRNPTYVGLFIAIIGQAFGSWALLAYAASTPASVGTRGPAPAASIGGHICTPRRVISVERL